MLTRNLDEARKAYYSGDVSKSKNAHNTKQALNIEGPLLDKNQEHKEKHQKGGEFLKSAVYGGLDGMITTYSVVMGAAGASLGVGVILILGIANMIGDGLSMALGDYVSTKSEREFQKSERKREKWEVENNIEGEKEEMVEIYMGRGLTKEDAQTVTEIISKHKDAFVDIMMVEELGLIENDESAGYNALVTFFSFILFGIVPILPYIVSRIAGVDAQLLLVSTVLTCLSLFSLGVIKTIFTMGKWYWSGLETLLIGSFAAAASYFIGAAMEPLAT